MAMEQMGYVTQVSQKDIQIRVLRESACGGNCAGCHGCPSDAVVFSYPIQEGESFSVGDAVHIYMETKTFFGHAAMSYGLMSVLLFTGAVLGYVWFQTELASVVGSGIGLGVGAGIMKLVSLGKTERITVEKAENQK